MKISTALSAGILASLLMGTLAGTYTSLQNQQAAKRQLARISQEAASQLKGQIAQVDLKLQAIRALVMGANQPPGQAPDPAALAAYLQISPPLKHFALIRGFCLIQPVAPEQADAFTAQAQAYYPNFTLQQYSANESTRYLLTYIQPVSKLGDARGLDLASEPNRRETLERAAKLGSAQLTPPLISTQKTLRSTPDFLMVLPVLSPRDQSLYGWIGAPLFIADLWQTLDATQLVEFQLKDQSVTFTSSAADQHSDNPATPQASMFPLSASDRPQAVSQNIALMGRQWQLTVLPKAAFYAQLNGASVVYSAFLAATLGLTITLLATYAHRRRRDRAELEKSQQSLLGQLIDSAPCGMMFIDQDYRFVAVNKRLCELTNYTRDALVGQYFHLIMGKDEQGENLLADSESQTSNTIGDINFDMVARRADGSQFPAAVGFSTLALNDSRYIVATLEDISARKAIEKRVKDSENLFRRLANAMPQHVWMAHEQEGLTFINSRMQSYFGRPINQLQYANWPEIIHPKDLALTQIAWQKSQEDNKTFEAECRLKRHDGSYRWHIVRASKIADPQSQEMLWYGTSTDISAHKRVQLESQTNAENTQAIIDSVVDALITIDEWGTIDSVNQSAKSLFGYAEEEMVGHNVKLLMPEPHHTHHDQYLDRFRTTGERKIIGKATQLEGRHKDGSLFKIELRVAENRQGKKRYFLGMVRDITDRFYNEKLLECQDHILSLIARNTDMPITLEALVRDIEGLAPDLRASILLLDPTGSRLLHGAAPRCFLESKSFPKTLPPMSAGWNIASWHRSITCALAGLRPYLPKTICSAPLPCILRSPENPHVCTSALSTWPPMWHHWPSVTSAGKLKFASWPSTTPLPSYPIAPWG